MRRLSPALLTSIILLNNRFTRLDFLRRRWLLPPLVRMTLPVFVTLKRLAAALYVFILYFFFFFLAIVTLPHTEKPLTGFYCLLYRAVNTTAGGSVSLRAQHHHHSPAFEIRRLFHFGHIFQVGDDAVHDGAANFRVVNLAPFEADDDLNFFALF